MWMLEFTAGVFGEMAEGGRCSTGGSGISVRSSQDTKELLLSRSDNIPLPLIFFSSLHWTSCTKGTYLPIKILLYLVCLFVCCYDICT